MKKLEQTVKQLTDLPLSYSIRGNLTVHRKDGALIIFCKSGYIRRRSPNVGQDAQPFQDRVLNPTYQSKELSYVWDGVPHYSKKSVLMNEDEMAEWIKDHTYLFTKTYKPMKALGWSLGGAIYSAKSELLKAS